MPPQTIRYYIHLGLLLKVLRSHTLIDPRLEPTITFSSLSEKIREVRAETLEVCELRTVRGF
jgi:hypothetical protein